MKYLLLARTNTGEIMEKVCVDCELNFAIQICKSMMATTNKITKGEIIEGNKQWIGDFTVKPLYKLQKIDDDYGVTDCADIFKKLTV